MEASDVKDRAHGRWMEILGSIGVGSEFLTGKHSHCPWCGGKDRFRFDDKEGSGSFICAQCGAGDGLEFVARHMNLSTKTEFAKVLNVVARVLGMEAEENNDDVFRREYLRSGNALASYIKVYGNNGENLSTLKSRAARKAKRIACNQDPVAPKNTPVAHPVVCNQDSVAYKNTPVAPLVACNQDPVAPKNTPVAPLVACNQDSVASQNTSVAPLVACNQDSVAPLVAPNQPTQAQIKRQNNALKLWGESAPNVDALKAYLSSRAITVPPPEALRFHAKNNMVVALMQNGAGDSMAISRTFLNPSVPKEKKKMMLGLAKGCAVRLVDHSFADGKMAIGEGIETCLSFFQATGIPTWSCLTDGGLKAFEIPKPKPNHIVILADIDEPKNIHGRMKRAGEDAALKAAQRIANRGIQVSIAWPGDPTGEKVDFNDLLQTDPSGESIRDALAEAQPVRPNLPPTPEDYEKTTQKPVIQVMAGHLPKVMRQAETVLVSGKSTIFQRSGRLVRIAMIPKTDVKRGIRRDGNALIIIPVESAWLELSMSDVIRFEKWDGRRGAWTPIDCPADIPRVMIANIGGWKFPSLTGVIEAPTLRPDGSILDKPGYDEQTGLYLETGGISYPPIPVNPSRIEALAALKVLESVVAEFPFQNLNHKSTALAVILTALVRRSLRSAPLFGITAPMPGSGKSLLADAVAMISTGRTAPAITHTADPAEEKKRLLTILMEGDSVALIDNVDDRVSISSDALCSILTQETYKDRVLGESRSVTVSTSTTWIATGNNLKVRGDMSTRVLMIRINPGVEHPEERAFRKDLRVWIPTNRPMLVTTGITVLRAYAAAGRPDTGLPTYGRFEEWAKVVRDALVWCGMPDPCNTRREVEDSDSVKSTLGALLIAWWETLGDTEITIADLVARAFHIANPPNDWTNHENEKASPNPALLNALLEAAGDQKGNINNRKLGWWLKRYRGRIECGFMISDEAKKDTKTKVEIWSIRQSFDRSNLGVIGVIEVSPIPHVGNVSCSENTEIHTHDITRIRAGGKPDNPTNPETEEMAF